MLKFIEDFVHPLDGPDFSPAMDRALASTGSAASPTGFSLYFGNKVYPFSRTIHLTRAMSFIGSGAAGRYAGTVFQFPAGVDGLVCDYDPGFTLGTGAWSIVERIAFRPATGPTAATPMAHGITMHARMTVRDCYISNFTGNGIHIEASTNGIGKQLGNANNWVVTNVRIEGCLGDGFSVAGSDANAGCATELDSSENKGWGIRETTFLGNTYVACHCAANGVGAFTTRGASSGLSNRNERSLFLNCYEEGGQVSQIDHPAIVLGGNLNLSTDSDCVQLTSLFGRAYFDNGVAANNRQTPQSLGTLGSDPGVAFGLFDDSPWAYRMHAPSPGGQWWQLKWAESVAPIQLSMEHGDGSSPLTGGQLWLENGFLMGADGQRIRVMTGTQAPAAGSFQVGDRVMNQTPTVGDYAGWVCVEAGSPGTWARFGKIDPM